MSKQPGVMFTEPNEFVAEISRDHARGLVGLGDDEQVQQRATELVRELENELVDAGLEPRAGLSDD